MRLLLATLLLACSPAPLPLTHHAATAHPATCPSSFTTAKVGDECSGPVDCPFAEGACTCTTGSYCGGTPPPEEIERETRRLRWVCQKRPPEVRDDGCPGVLPTGACGSDPRDCHYADGCCSVVAKCLEGQWKVTDHQCPP